jgi:hypothetical protein
MIIKAYKIKVTDVEYEDGYLVKMRLPYKKGYHLRMVSYIEIIDDKWNSRVFCFTRENVDYSNSTITFKKEDKVHAAILREDLITFYSPRIWDRNETLWGIREIKEVKEKYLS